MELIFLEYLNCKKEEQKMCKELLQIPKGAITYRTSKGKRYCYWQFREQDGRVRNQIVAEEQIANMKQQIERRKYLRENIKILTEHIGFLERKYPQFKEQTFDLVEEGKGYLTSKGDYVRSKAEVIIANELYQANIFYVYEKPLVLEGCKYTFLPDFTIQTPKMGKIVYWEHCGLMDDDKYRSKWDWKKNLYAQHGIAEWNHNLIMTYETKKEPLRVELVREGVERLKNW